MRGGRALVLNNTEAVVIAYRQAWVNGAAEKAKAIYEANPDLHAEFKQVEREIIDTVGSENAE